jgi:nickel/cobalt transporter (NicO) family protein
VRPPRRRRSRAGLFALAVIAALLATAAPAGAHPLGNFSFNHLTYVSASSGRVELRYVLDQAEIPTFQERGRPDAQVLAAKRAEVLRNLTVTSGGARVPLRALPGATISHPPGQGGLRLTRVELPVEARTTTAPRAVAIHDGTFAGRVGWVAIVPRPGRGTAARTPVERGDPTGGLRTYPRSALESPRHQRDAALTVRPGHGTLDAPRGQGPTGPAASDADRGGDGFAGVLEDAAAGRGVLVFLLLAAFGWGALHALSPGHGKAMVAAYLVGTRGTARHAAALGGIVTITHTAGVFALGLVTLVLSQFVVPEQLYPWLTLASGLLVVIVGAGVVRSRLRARRARRAHAHAHADHHHHHHDDVTTRGLLAMGASAGLIPCPSALVVLLGAISQHEVLLGMLLIVAFSAGLAAAMTAVGVAVVYAGRLTARLDFRGRIATALPVASGIVIVAAGLVLSARALPEVL